MSVFSNPKSGAKDEAQSYVDALLGLIGDRDPLDVLRETPSTLPGLIADLSEDRLRRPEHPGKWSIAAVVQHLADSELVWGFRLRMAISEERPTIAGYDQDLWASALRYDEANMDRALGMFELLRSDNLSLIEKLSPQDRQRPVVHSERGEETIEFMIPLYAGHDLVHRRQIERIRSNTREAD